MAVDMMLSVMLLFSLIGVGLLILLIVFIVKLGSNKKDQRIKELEQEIEALKRDRTT